MRVQQFAYLCVALAFVSSAQAALQDEIQVYGDDINSPGETSLELHVNATPSASGAAAYPGESVNLHGTRMTSEIGYGLTKTVDVALYLPVVRDQTGGTTLAGVKFRAKWLPLQPEETPQGKVGAFAGANVEVAFVKHRFDDARRVVELRNIVGYRALGWSVAANPVFRWGLMAGYRGAPEFALNLRAMKALGSAGDVGLEYYDVLGNVGSFATPALRDRRVFAVWERDLANGWGIHLGLGRGLGTGDRYTVKSILSVPISGN